MTFTVDDSQKAGLLIADGTLTIQQAVDFKDTLTKAISEVYRLEINFDTVTEIDLACLQLLCSAHKTCVKANKTLSITGRQSEALKKAIKDAGYERRKGCKAAGDNNQCLWVTGGDNE
jgi:anti-anti-sigma regulatory factor